MIQEETDYKRIFLAVFLAAIVLIGWQALVEWPRRQHLAHMTHDNAIRRDKMQAEQAKQMPLKDAEAEDNPNLTRAQRVSASPRINIASDKLHGSISLKGARFDDLTLAKYRETIDPTSPEVTLFSPNGDDNAYFAQVGWLSGDNKTKVPDQHTLWESQQKAMFPGQPAKLQWSNGEGVTYFLTVTMDRDYMFHIEQGVENHSGHSISVMPYAYINRAYEEPAATNAILHEGPIGTMDGTLSEIKYKELRDKGNKSFEKASGWFGVTDKYWLSALVPGEEHFKTTINHYIKNKRHRYQVDYLADAQVINDGSTANADVRLFAGAKELQVLDRYATGNAHEPPIPLFDRSVDFGSLYFLTKPMFLMLNFFFAHIGNFGIAIMMLTIVVKLCMYPLANKAFKATAAMRELQPEMMKIRERFVDDQISLNKEMLSLYKREKVNPASGCLPVLIQMPVFFALYKVLYVTIEMRHAPFFGWLHDLSAIDTSNLFTGFGTVVWNTPEWMHLGLLPMLMCATMIIQMRQQPKPADPVQAKMMAWMPFFLLIIFAKMPAGLVLYWTWSNMISILQQSIISKRYHASKLRVGKAKATAA